MRPPDLSLTGAGGRRAAGGGAGEAGAGEDAGWAGGQCVCSGCRCSKVEPSVRVPVCGCEVEVGGLEPGLGCWHFLEQPAAAAAS